MTDGGAKPAAEPAKDRSTPPGGPARQAYILIHGMGEQRPMDTVKGFAASIWSLDTDVQRPGMADAGQMWSRPDSRTGSLELRRLTTRRSRVSDSFPKGVRTDFYELYWADLSAGSTWGQFVAWVRYLLFRPWSKVPVDVRAAWLCLWLAALVVTGLGLVSLIPDATWREHAPSWFSKAIAAALAAGLLAFMHRAAASTFGRVVRYTRADPDNIAARKAVRERGLTLLRDIHSGDAASGGYDRVVLVGHSLGSILAHDLVSYFWAEQMGAQAFISGSFKGQAVSAVEAAAEAMERDPSAATLAAFRAAQGRLGRILRTQSSGAPLPSRWLISDLVTIGSPLTHAEFLLADGAEALEARGRARELPLCPPFREALDPQLDAAARLGGMLADGQTRLMSYRPNPMADGWALHFAAPFAAVRWTNVFDPARRVAQGDMISGPLAPNFGRGIVDLDISKGDRPSRRFSHTRYWNAGQPAARLATLRQAANLLDR